MFSLLSTWFPGSATRSCPPQVVHACHRFLPITALSALGATLATGGWLALTRNHFRSLSRPGLAPGKKRQALLGAPRPDPICSMTPSVPPSVPSRASSPNRPGASPLPIDPRCSAGTLGRRSSLPVAKVSAAPYWPTLWRVPPVRRSQPLPGPWTPRTRPPWRSTFTTNSFPCSTRR